MRVITGISGSHCVVEIVPGCNGTYIDARQGHYTTQWGQSYHNGFTNIEVVHSGHVCHRETVKGDIAPNRIIELMRSYQ